MRKSVIYTLLAISLFAMLGTGCSKKAEQKSETTKVVADIVLKNKDNIVGFLDDNTELEESFAGFPVLGTTDQYQKYSDVF